MTFARRLQQGVQHSSSGPPPPPPGTTLMGVPFNTNDHGGFSQWDAMRVYSFAKVNQAVATGPSVIALTDEPVIDIYGGATSANLLDSKLTTLFNANPGIEVHWANGNEIDIDGYSASYLSTCAAMRAVIDDHQSQGHNVTFWIDVTANKVRTGTQDAEFKPVAQYLDGIGGSFYPPGRKKNPLEYDDFDSYIKPFFDLAQDWGITKLSCWETGIGPDTNTTHPASTNETATTLKVRQYGQASMTTLSVSGTKQVRPAYAAYMAKYIVDAGQAYGIQIPELLWWDQQTSPTDPDAVLSHDPVGTSPTTAQSWRDWQSYT